jgi:EAL domain-containing protein (putative c-di-GMP-specific phosphodiesterase class I)/GGDEF domain-containing protein
MGSNMDATARRVRHEADALKYRMSDSLVHKIMLGSALVAAISAVAEYAAQIFPATMVVDTLSALFLTSLFMLRKRIASQVQLSLLLGAGLLTALTSIAQNPFAPDGYIVMSGVVAVSFANWPLRRALVIPGLTVVGLSLVTLAIGNKLIVIAPLALHAQNSAAAMLIVAMCMALLTLAMGGAIHELKSRLMRHIHLLEGANARLETYAFDDAGTGLGNEHYLEKMVDADLAGGGAGALLVVNLVGMELYHAVHGHKERDTLLRTVADALREGLREQHLLAKLDGAQFAVWTPDHLAIDSLYLLVKALIEARVPLARYGIAPTAAVVVAPEHGCAYRALMKNILVVQSMLPASESGACLRFTVAMESDIKARVALKARIRHALDNDGFHPVYQAKVHAGSHAIAGFEGLARIGGAHAQAAPGPAVFIPVLHEEGWMTEFGMIMLRHIIADIPAFVASYGADIQVAANVSPPLFLSPQFAGELKALLAQAGVDARRLVIEITEEVFTADIEKIRKVCRELQLLGVQISLDDFGSGFSSLSFLRSMQFDEIKIDRSFLAGIEHDEKSFLLLSSICKLGSDLRCRVVVEGVETAAQLALVEQTQCAEIQGFYFAKPQPARTLLARERALPA